ncbi:MAG: hypothetical protein IT430_12060 [Phycisphaerales bacterium]|nr:hypothetical protein [Phycisphaerales bacterium]
MKFRVVFWLIVVLTPVAVYFMLTVGRQYDDYLAGRLLQVLGGFVGLGWTTWAFLEVAQGLTRLFRANRSDLGEPVESAELESTEPGRPPRRRAA